MGRRSLLSFSWLLMCSSNLLLFLFVRLLFFERQTASFFLLSWLAFGACHPSFLLLSSLSSAVAAAAAVDAGLSCFCWSWVTVWAACVRSVAAGTCSTYSLPKRRRCGFRLVVGLFAWTGIPKSPSLSLRRTLTAPPHPFDQDQVPQDMAC